MKMFGLQVTKPSSKGLKIAIGIILGAFALDYAMEAIGNGDAPFYSVVGIVVAFVTQCVKDAETGKPADPSKVLIPAIVVIGGACWLILKVTKG